MRVTAPFNYLARKLLHTWVRCSVLPGEATDLGLDPARALCFVTESRSWANLLVLEQHCRRLGLVSPFARMPGACLRRWSANYCLQRRAPFLFWRRPPRSAMLLGLLRCLAEDPALDLQLLPVSIFWGRAPAREKHWLKVLFADTWSVAGRTRKFFTILLHGRDTLLILHPHISLRALLAQHGGSGEEAADFVDETLQKLLDGHRAATLGPDMSHRRTLVRELLRDARVREAIETERSAKQLTAEAATARARRYLYEIAAASTGATIQLLFRVLTAFWNRFYDGIEVHHIEQVRRLAPEAALVYVPCHRSHIDYLLLSYVIYTHGLAIPSVAAGRNLDLPVLGAILRRGGAFFIRRSFSGDRLYSDVLFEYLARLISRGAPVKYFIEGTRSRTGRSLQARPGMLAMTVRAYLREPNKAVVFVPVYIGYERLIEGRSYLGELEGRAKQRETLFGALRSMLNLRGRFGKVSVSFGEPLALDGVLEQYARDWRERAYDDRDRPQWLRQVVDHLGRELLTRINGAASLNPVNLVSLVLLAMPRYALGEAELLRQLTFCATLARRIDYSAQVTVPQTDAAGVLREARDLRVVRRHEHPLGTIWRLRPGAEVLMTYYRNNVLHLFAVPSMVACCFLNLRSLRETRVLALVRLVYPFVRRELFLPWPEEEHGEVVRECIALLVDLRLLSRDGDRLRRPGPRSPHAQSLTMLARAIQPLLERFFLIIAALRRRDGAAPARADLEKRCFLLAQRLSILYQLDSPDFYDKPLFDNFVNALLERGYLVVDADGGLTLTAAADEVDEDARLMLSPQVRESILEATGAEPRPDRAAG